MEVGRSKRPSGRMRWAHGFATERGAAGLVSWEPCHFCTGKWTDKSSESQLKVATIWGQEGLDQGGTLSTERKAILKEESIRLGS